MSLRNEIYLIYSRARSGGAFKSVDGESKTTLKKTSVDFIKTWEVFMLTAKTSAEWPQSGASRETNWKVRGGLQMEQLTEWHLSICWINYPINHNLISQETRSHFLWCLFEAARLCAMGWNVKRSPLAGLKERVQNWIMILMAFHGIEFLMILIINYSSGLLFLQPFLLCSTSNLRNWLRDSNARFEKLKLYHIRRFFI